MDNHAIIGLKKTFKQYRGITVLEDISLEIFEGDFYALLGHNGAGKSTLLKIISGIEYATKGSGIILEKNIEHDLGEVKSSIGFVSEDINFNFPVPLKQFFKAYSMLYPNWNQLLFQTLMDKREIDLKKEFSEFSRGEKMQIALIAALSQSPKILLIDEITSVLDVYARKYFIDHLKKFTNLGGTVVMTTNVIDEIQTYCTKTIILKHGKLLLDTEVCRIPQFLTKIRATPQNDTHPIFKHKSLFFVTTNNDQSKSYLIRNDYIKTYDLNEVLDRRQITLHELFLFYTGHELAEASKNAAKGMVA